MGVDADRDHMRALFVYVLRQYFQIVVRQQAVADS